MQKTEKNNKVFDFTRREFLGSCAACAAGVSTLSTFGSSALGLSLSNISNNEKLKVRLVFAHPDPTKPNWPNIGYDFAGQIRDLTKKFKTQCSDVDFFPITVTSGSEEQGKKILKKDSEVDAYIVYLVGCLWGDMSEIIATSGKPTIYVDNLYAGSGEFLTSFARAKRAGGKVIAVSSSQFSDVVQAVRCVDSLKKLQNSTILVVGGNPDKKIKPVYGTQVRKVDFSEINKAYKKADPNKIEKCADRWIKEAEKVIEPPRSEIEKAAGMYLAMFDIMQKYNARAITVNCLGGIYSGKMVDAYPCMGFMQLNNDGYVGACEADQRSTITMLLMTYLAGQSGFISDPVIDTAKNQIIYAHCVAPTKAYGPDGPSNPYHIRDHSEDRRGASIRSLLPLGVMTTTLLFDHNKKQVIFHQGKSVENVDEDKACRTKLAVEVKGDVYKLLNYWDQWGWHRVTFFGDFKRQVYNVASLLGFEVVEEA
ncbi:hypothetical protein ISS22_02555 [candidate division KSB1 bacterium]|nr:hypothetical protein [candidate division KSB1 bacterium]